MMESHVTRLVLWVDPCGSTGVLSPVWASLSLFIEGKHGLRLLGPRASAGG